MTPRFVILSLVGLLAVPGWLISAPTEAVAVEPAIHSAPTASSSSAQLLPRDEARTRPVLRRGSRGPWVSAVQTALSVPVNGRFNRPTGRAVKRFRRSVGLTPRMKVNRKTWRYLGYRVVPPAQPPSQTPAAPAPASDRGDWPELRRGHVSEWVRALQAALAIDADGVFGPGTQAAVEDFQRASGLPVSGVVDTATWQALGDRVTAPAVDPTTTEAARSSASHRATIPVADFVGSWTARMVVDRESGGNCAITNPNGRYMGKWQMSQTFWEHYGGAEFAAAPHRATCEQQDIVAYRGWVAEWWSPWPTAIP